MSSVGDLGGHESAATGYRHPDEGHPASDTDHAANLLRRFEETDRFPTGREEAREAARDLKAAVKEYGDVKIDAYKEAITSAKADIKAAEAQLEAMGQSDQALQARGKALLADEKLGIISLTDEEKRAWTLHANGDIISAFDPERDNVQNILERAKDRQQSAEQGLAEAQRQATALLEQAKEFARPWVDSTKWWRPLKSRDARMELIVRRSDHQNEQQNEQRDHQIGQLQETLQGLRAEIAGLRTSLAAGSGDTPPPRPPSGDSEDVRETDRRMAEGYANDIGRLDPTRRPTDGDRQAMVNNALEGLLPPDSITGQIEGLLNESRSGMTEDVRADANERLDNLSLALYSSDDDLARLRSEVSPDEMINGLRGLDDAEQRAAAARILGVEDINSPEAAERVQQLDEERRRGDPTGQGAQRRMMLLMALQQGVGAIVTGLFSFNPPQS